MSQKRESKYVRFARLAYAVAQVSVPRYAHPKSPQRFTQPQLVVCLLLTQYLNLSYRNTEEWLLASAEVRDVLELTEVPDHTTISRMLKRLTLLRLEALLTQVLNQLEGKEDVVAIDATGFRFTSASAYYTTRSGRKHRDWVKGVYVVGTRSQMILAWASAHHVVHDTRFLAPLKLRIARYGRQKNGKRDWLLLADAGFDCPKLTDRDLAPPIRRGGKLVDPDRKARADLVSQARLDGLFGQRWKSETVHSVIKRLFGDVIRSRSWRLQRREPMLKALVYNIHR
jgi:IS5 family transposase